MDRNTLRLLITQECHRNCEGCCNKEWNLSELPTIKSYSGYDIICLTGGEPMLNILNILDVVEEIRKESMANIYVYTAKTDNIDMFYYILSYVNGFTVTLHDRFDIRSFKALNEQLLFNKKLAKNKSLRLNVFDGIDLGDIDLSLWKVKKEIVWIKNCPLLENEVFMKWR